MKRLFSFVLVLTMVISLCACANTKELEATITQQKEEISRLQEEITSQKAQITALEKDREMMEQYREKLNTYSWVIDNLESDNYDFVIYRTEEIRREKELEALAALGVTEVAITPENWDVYFEPVVYGYSYIKNSFGETTVVNVTGGIKLKDDYRLAEDVESLVNFEFVLQTETRSCTVNFDSMEITIGEPKESSYNRTETATSRFQYAGEIYEMISDRPRFTAGVGYIDQVNADKGRIVTEDVVVYKIAEVLRVEGTLYIYGN